MSKCSCKPISVKNAAAMLLSQADWLILSHQYPDGDTLGCAFALCRALQLAGRKARVVCADAFPEKYDYLTEEMTFDEVSGAHVCAVDVADTKLLGTALEQQYGDKIDLCIDHHQSNVRYARHLLLQDRSAAAMVVMQVIAAMGVSPDRLIGEALYTGIATDTGCFKYSNTTAQTHKMAAKLMAMGIRADMINRQMFDIKSRARIELERLALADMEFFFDGRVALMTITLDMVEKAGAEENDMEGLSPLPRQIEGVWVGVTLREKAGGGYKVSLRTGTHASAAAIAKLLGGGGHEAAAGCAINRSASEARERLLTAICEAVPNIKEG